MKTSRPVHAFVYALLAVLFWSTCPTAFKLALRHQDTLTLLTGASLSSLAVLGLLLIPEGRYRKLKAFSTQDHFVSLALGLMNPLAYYLILFRAYQLLPAQVAQPLNMIWPIVLVLISVPMLGKKVGWRSLVAMFISFSGVALVSFQGGRLGKEPGDITGILLALSTSVVWAFYWIFNARDRKDPVARLFMNFLYASILLVAAGLVRGQLLAGTAEGMLGAAYVGIFEMGITFVLWLLAMQLAPAPDRISNLVYMAPFINLLIVNLVLDEAIYRTTVFGIILLVTGIVVQNMDKKNAGAQGQDHSGD